MQTTHITCPVHFAVHPHPATYAKKGVIRLTLTIDLMFCYGQVIVRELPEQEQAAAHNIWLLSIQPSDSEADQGASVVPCISRLHMEYIRFWFYPYSHDKLGQAEMPTAMSDFLRLVLQHMSSTRMASCLNSSSSPSRGLVEAQYQNEFYR